LTLITFESKGTRDCFLLELKTPETAYLWR